MPIKDSLQVITKCVVPELKIRPAYQIGYNIYKTPRGAASKLAWNWIMTKYSGYSGGRLEGIDKILDLECSCCFTDEGYFDTDCCNIHNRQSGYFKRLHRKCVSAIIKEWERNEKISD